MKRTRHATVKGPLADGVLLLVGMTGSEALAQPFEFTLELLSQVDDIDLSSVLGQPLGVELELRDGNVREFNGVVTQFSMVGEQGRYTRYRALLRPWLWLLSQTSNSRIFQGKTAPEVVKEVFRQRGFVDFSEVLSSEYRTWEYLVQYRESDFHFVSRLLEQEGIYYFFRHEEGRHTLVLADAVSAHQAVRGSEALPYHSPQAEPPALDHVDGWSTSRQFLSGTVELGDFDFEHPAAKPRARADAVTERARTGYELYEHPGVFRSEAEAKEQARIRIEALEADYEVARATGNARNLRVGALFKLERHPRDDQHKEYLVSAASYRLRVDDYESTASGAGEPDFRCEVTALDAKRQYRALRSTPKPRVDGPQTALVVGPAGQEIFTDEYGRVKLQFHWDRAGQSDQHSSCWVRVAQVWAGSGFGGLHVPRIGQEVIVDFLEGDPDRPIVTGRVYNADNLPPYELPANQTRSGIKSRSTRAGSANNANEIRFEDKRGQEELYIQAERDQTTLIKANQSVSVGANQSLSVGANQSLSVGANQSLSVGAMRSLSVLGPDSESYLSSRDVNVAQDDSLTVGQKHTGTYSAGREVVVNQFDTSTVNGGDKYTLVHGKYLVAADVQVQLTQGANSLTLEGGQARIDNGQCAVSLSEGVVNVIAAQELTLLCGAARITLTQDGTIEIVGTGTVTTFVAGNAVEVGKTGVAIAGQKASVAGRTMTEITGGIVKIN